MPMRGAKWMMTSNVITEADRKYILSVVEEAKAFLADHSLYSPSTVGVRSATYTGEPAPFATVTYGPGGSSLYALVYRTKDGKYYHR